MLRLSTLFIMALVSVSAEANILLLNFNGNDTTVALAKSYAAENSLELYTYPSASVSEINRDSLPKILEEVQNQAITTVIFSGHAGYSFFSGKSGVLSRKDFMDVAKGYSGFQQSVTAVYARGCYSATKGDFFGDVAWSKLFPNLNFVAGYEGKAWSSESPQSQSFVKNMLQLKSEFLSAKTEAEILNTYKKFERHYDSETAVWIKQDAATFYVSTVQIQNQQPVINFVTVASSCETLRDKVETIADEINAYFQGSKVGFQRPPENHSSGKVRQHYTWVLQNQHCQLLEVWDHARELNPQFVMSLLFFDKLAKNFSLNFSPIAYQQSLDWLETQTGQKFTVPNIAIDSRESIRKFSMEVTSIVTNARAVPGLEDKIDSYEYKLLQYYASAFHMIISELQTVHIPYRWLTEDVSFDQPLGITMPSQYSFGPGSSFP